MSEQDAEKFDYEKRNKIMLVLLADLFSMRPTLKTEKQRFKIIGELQAINPELFGEFLNQHIAKQQNNL